jgi:hypothetical protein
VDVGQDSVACVSLRLSFVWQEAAIIGVVNVYARANFRKSLEMRFDACHAADCECRCFGGR